MKISKASRKKAYLKIGISGSTGFGKTFSSLLIAKGLVGDWNKVTVIDTENDSASLYDNIGEYNTIPVQAPYTAERYIEAIEMALAGDKSQGIPPAECIIIDSISHLWKGAGGLLEKQNELGGRYQDWAKVLPIFEKWKNVIMSSPAHFITTVREKQTYALQLKETGKQQVVKMGLDSEFKDGWEYELTVSFKLINDQHFAIASKDRTQLFNGEFLISEETGKMIKDWANSGFDYLAVPREELTNAKTIDEVKGVWVKYEETLKSDKEFIRLVNESKERVKG